MADEAPTSHKYESLLSVESLEHLNEIKSRKVSAASIVSASSGVSEFLDYKIKDAELDIDYAEKCKKGVVEAYERKSLEKEELFKALESIKEEGQKKKKEYVTLKRQRKLIEDDIEEGAESDLEKAYASAMMNRVRIPEQLTQSKRNFKMRTQNDFRQALETYYGVVRKEVDGESEQELVYCAVTQVWWLSRDVRAAHIVPKSLQSEELSYLFGAGDMDLSDTRNGLILHRKIEEALDRGIAVIVPMPSKDSIPSEWKFLLTAESLREQVAVQMVDWKTIKWKDLDERVLKFPNENRPASRYLYFKYIMTYLMTKESGNTKWAERSPNQGTMWCIPGLYLRRSMLKSLARQVSDHYLPPDQYLGATFENAVEEPNRSPDHEKVLAMSLGLKVEDGKANASKRALTEEESSDDEKDD